MVGHERDGLKWKGRHAARAEHFGRSSRRPAMTADRRPQPTLGHGPPVGAEPVPADDGLEPGIPTFELRLLGEPALLRDGRACTLSSSRKTRALLAYLAATARAQRRDHLCTLLWGVPDDPKAALRWSLGKLRALVDDPGRPRLICEGDARAPRRTRPGTPRTAAGPGLRRRGAMPPRPARRPQRL